MKSNTQLFMLSQTQNGLQHVAQQFPPGTYFWTGYKDKFGAKIYNHHVVKPDDRDEILFVNFDEKNEYYGLYTIRKTFIEYLTHRNETCFTIRGHLSDIELKARFFLTEKEIFLVFNTMGFRNYDEIPKNLIDEYRTRLRNVIETKGVNND